MIVFFRALRDILVGLYADWWEELMLSGNRFRVKGFLASFSVLVVLAGMLFGANIAAAAAAADSVQVQSYQRASQTEACVAQPGETPWQASWGTNSSWSPSWERWANKGNGGWTCTRSITWARSPLVEGSSDASCDVRLTYSVGDIGPGCGLVFLISGGKTYEMAPKTWTGASDPAVNWCNNVSLDVLGAVDTAIGTGATNTAAMKAACTSGAANSATAYSGSGFTDWFLPSKDELNAMYTYSRVSGFDTLTYGFGSDIYWSSSQFNETVAWAQGFDDGTLYNPSKSDAVNQRVRPIRSF